jgi:hypothetical protein
MIVPAIVIERSALPVRPLLSDTRTMKLDVPAVVGVPLITPVEGASDSPTGKFPAVIDQVVYVPLPPMAVRGCE